MQTAVRTYKNEVSPEVREKLALSERMAQTLERRPIKCPICGFYIFDEYGRDHHIVRAKCRKCKFDEPIDTAYFRTQRHKKVKFKYFVKPGIHTPNN